jgi:NADH dehydrogenase [ubiquinone] 1 alpha subcomplex assembly factor 2
MTNDGKAQWMQWLRHTRAEPPSINEQQLDEIRQAQMKQLAAAADARWASKPSFLDAPSKQQPSIGSMLKGSQKGPDALAEIVSSVVQNSGADGAQQVAGGTDGDVSKATGKSKKEYSPTSWKGVTFGKKGEAQPDSWTPKLAKRR